MFELSKVTTIEIIEKIHDLLLGDPKLKVSEIAEVVNVSKEYVGNILHEHLLTKPCIKMVVVFVNNQSKT